MTPYFLELPIPPSVNSYYWNARRKTKSGKVYTGRVVSDEGMAYRKAVAEAAGTSPPMLGGSLSIKVLACKPTHDKRGHRVALRKGDLDNLFKCLLDSLTHASVIRDDVQFDEVHMVRGKQIEKGALFVTIERFDPDAAVTAFVFKPLPADTLI